jgi:hypothetical protein
MSPFAQALAASAAAAAFAQSHSEAPMTAWTAILGNQNGR